MSLMQRSNVTVSHLSPMIQYWPSNGWWEDTLEEDEDDQLLQGYSTRTNHRTDGSVQNATATFQWHGEGGIWIFGGYRQRLGNFWVVLNDTKTFIVPGFQPGDKEQAQAVLFSQEDIPFGRHQMQIVNPGGDDDGHGILDLDYIVFQTSAPTTSVPDNSTDISWLPVPPDDKSVVWRQTSNSHYTNQTNAQVEYSFNGNLICYSIPVRKLIFTIGTGIEVWGSLCAQSAPFVVSVDGWQGKTFQPNINRNFSIEEPQLLFFQYGMSDTPKQHTLKISNGASSSGRNVIDINSLKVANAVDTVQIPGPTSSSSPPKSHTVAIAVGVSVGAVVLIAVLIFLWRWFNSRRGHQKQEYDLVRPRPYGPNGPSGSPMTSVVFNSIHSTADRLSQQFRTPTKHISTGSTENLMLDIRKGQDVEMSVPTNRTMESGDVEPPTSPQATLAPDDYEGGSILVPQQTLDSRSSRYLSRTPTLILGGRKPSRSTTLETLCGDDPDGVPLLDPSLPPRLPSLAFSPSPTMIAFPRMSRIPSGRLSRPGSRISPSGPREPRNRSIRIPSIHTTNPPASFLHMSRSSQSTAGQTTTTSSS